MIWIDVDMPKNCMCCPFPSVGTDFYYCHCPGVEERAYDFAQAESIPDDCPLHEPDTDTISRQAAYDTLTEYYHHKTDIQHKALAEALSRVPSTSISQWIPCSERLPEEDGDYWVTVDPRHVPPRYKSTDVITWHNGKWMMADYFVIDGEGQKKPKYIEVPVNIPIIAWMPLPEPYRAERRTDELGDK